MHFLCPCTAEITLCPVTMSGPLLILTPLPWWVEQGGVGAGGGGVMHIAQLLNSNKC